MLNLAATLTTAASDDGGDTPDMDGSDMDGIDMDDMDDMHLRRPPEHEQPRRRPGDMDHRDRLQRSMERLNRLHAASAAAPSAQYSAGIPTQNSLYDWSPLPPTAPDDDNMRSLRALQARIHAVMNRAPPPAPAPAPAPAPDALRSTAILQAVRRHPRFSARTREYLQRFHYEHDLQAMRDAVRDGRDTAALRRSSQNPWAAPRDRLQPTRAPSQPQSHTPTPSHPPPPHAEKPAPMLEHAVQYLSRIRHSASVDESLHCALDAGFLTNDACLQYADFLTDPAHIPPPQQTSWLAPGAVLTGCQHATTPGPPLPPPSRPWLSTSHSPPQDRWPVKVTIHAVDYTTMTLSATMEAYNVPSHPHQHPAAPHYTRTSSITTYLEGELLDLATHTLLTESFASSPDTDARYWRRLPPFSALADDDVASALVSRAWWERVAREWVLMRWKERCFVRPVKMNCSTKSSPPSTHPLATPSLDPPAPHPALDDPGCGLTISGFYYVCLRRSDGVVKGLYCDPASSPFQCLELASQAGGGGGGGGGRFGAWAFV